jgi:hypothetical protein
MSTLSLPRVKGVPRHVSRRSMRLVSRTQRRPFGHARAEAPKNADRKVMLTFGSACTLVVIVLVHSLIFLWLMGVLDIRFNIYNPAIADSYRLKHVSGLLTSPHSQSPRRKN